MRNIGLLVACTAIFALVFIHNCDNGGGTPDPCNHNGVCEPLLGENTTNCADCNTTPVCGNGTCEVGENATNCPADCAGSYCGDGTCDANEDAASCPADCTGSYCGDGTCDANEDATSCPADCAGGQCTTTVDLYEQNGCPGESCTLTDQQGTIGCDPSGTNANYADCGNNQGCLAGALCAGDGTTSNCLPYCNLDDPNFVCPGGGICMFQIPTADGNVGLCGEGDACDPFAMTGCGGGEACYFVTGGNTICATAGTGALGSVCQFVDDCSPGMACVGNPGACAELCDAAFACTAGTCQGIGSIPNWPDIGYCQ